MKEKEALELIDAGWSRKPKGFRVHFQKKVDGQWQTDYVPENGHYDSDVVTWRLAWKLYQATKSDANETRDGEMLVNIFVEDDAGNPIKYYATGQYEVFNRLDTM
jgi:hypothetical protein